MDEDPEKQTMVEQDFRQAAQIDPKRARFPCCIVWTPLPVLSWFIPFIGHVGICREDGVILDFAGPNFVCVDSFAFGKVTRYVQIEKEKIFSAIRNNVDLQQNGNEAERRISTWDDALRTGSRKVLNHQQLVMECVEQLGRMFKPDFRAIKKRIEDLITREYLERDRDNANVYKYLA